MLFWHFQKYKNTFFAVLKMGKKSILAPKKCLKLWKMQFLDWNYTFFHVSGHSASAGGGSNSTYTFNDPDNCLFEEDEEIGKKHALNK